MIAVRAGCKRTAGEECRPNLYQAIAFMRWLRRHRAQRLRKRNGERRKARQSRCRARLDRMRFAIVEQRPKQPRDRVAMRDECGVARGTVECKPIAQRLAAVEL